MTGGTTAGNHCQETFAWGLRNPFRFSMDSNASGVRFFINDVPQDAWEEIDDAQAGADYGWNCREGRHVNNAGGPCNPTPVGMVDSIFEYQHGRIILGTTSPSTYEAITGGAFVPNGLWPNLVGAYLAADFTCGVIFRLTKPAGTWVASDLVSSLGGSAATSLVFGPVGNGQGLYYTTYAGGGQVWVITRNFPPVPQILTLSPGAQVSVGQLITLSGVATDFPDGPLPGSALSWRVILHHGALKQMLLWPVAGASVQFIAPAPVDLDAATNSYLEIDLTATDSQGAPAVISQNMTPHTVGLTFNTNPPGLTVRVNAQTANHGQTIVSWEGRGLSIQALPQISGRQTYYFSNWSDGGASTHAIMPQSTPAAFAAGFSTTVPVSVDADANGQYDALTDGLLILRHLFGLSRAPLTSGALGPGALYTTPAAVAGFLDAAGSALDVDADGNVDALTDGLLVVRYLSGMRGAQLIQGAVAAGATRNTAALIERYVSSLLP